MQEAKQEDKEEAVSRLRGHFEQLRNEDTVFERLVYKNTNQHRSCFYFRRLKQVRRSLRLLRAAAPEELFRSLSVYLKPKTRRTKAKPECRDAILNALLGTARIVQEINSPIILASRQLRELLKQGFFLPFAITAMAMLARIRVLAQQILLDVSSFYNLVSPDLFGRTPSLQPFSKLQKELPSSLDCEWDGCHYQLKEHKGAETWFIDDRGGMQQTLGNTGISVYNKTCGTPLLNTCQLAEAPKRVETPASQKLKMDFLDFLEKPSPTITGSASAGSNKRTAYVAVKTKTPGLDVPSTATGEDRVGISDVLNLLVSGRNNESLF